MDFVKTIFRLRHGGETLGVASFQCLGKKQWRGEGDSNSRGDSSTGFQDRRRRPDLAISASTLHVGNNIK